MLRRAGSVEAFCDEGDSLTFYMVVCNQLGRDIPRP
jgi:hypothetical protein